EVDIRGVPRKSVPRNSKRTNNQILNFVRVQALDKLSQIAAQRHRGGLALAVRRISRPAAAGSSQHGKAHRRHRLAQRCRNHGLLSPQSYSTLAVPFRRAVLQSLPPEARARQRIERPTRVLWLDFA